MANSGKHRLIILSGPSCVGKSPLDKALARHFPELRSRMSPVVLYNDRVARPGEVDGVDYHFRSRDDIEDLRSREQFVVMDVRGDLQALDLVELTDGLSRGDMFFEGNPFVGRTLQTHSALADVSRLSVFMSPISREELLFLQQAEGISLPDTVTDVMRRKLLRRTRKQKGELSLKDLENIEVRASSAYRELKDAHCFQHVLPNHDGEDSENWDAFYYPLGDARKSLLAFVALLGGDVPELAETWEDSLLL